MIALRNKVLRFLQFKKAFVKQINTVHSARAYIASFCLIAAMVYSQRCKWLNNGCSSNDECCSGKCELPHPGTNPRCARSSMWYPCLSGYHCEGRLKCGLDHVCCSGHWGTCSDSKDCCEKYHVCRQMKGFIYKKCLPRPRTLLFPRNSSQARDKFILLSFSFPVSLVLTMLLDTISVRLIAGVDI